MSSRDALIARLNKGFFDILVIGGGATGCGIALDAASRGLNTCLVEKGDFGCGTSGRSTKLVHGGVRYLEDAVLHFDKVQFNLVRDALKERYSILKNANYLANRLTLTTPLYKWAEVPYIYSGLVLYDLLAGKRSLGRSKLLKSSNFKDLCPIVKKEGLKAGVLYYDGQFNDVRLNIALVRTAAKFNALMTNYVEVVKLIKSKGVVCGAKVRDVITDSTFDISAKAVVNATGPYLDVIRKMDDINCTNMLEISSGVHIVIDKSFGPRDVGLMIPKTEDGRVLFVLPWLEHTLIGTTDEKATLEDNPKVNTADIEYILRHINRYFSLNIKKEHIMSSWSGLRPLVKDLKASDTAKLSRDHVIEISPSMLFSIGGGKWTTYRKMAQDMVDKLIEKINFGEKLMNAKCITDTILIDGASNTIKDHMHLTKNYRIDDVTAKHLYSFYGTYSQVILERASVNGFSELDKDFPYLEEEIKYHIDEEYAVKVVDILIRRLSLALVDLQGARKIAGKVLGIMSKYLEWDNERVQKEEKAIEERLYTAL